MARLPAVGGDNGNWGQILNDFLSVEHNSDGTLKKAGDIATAQADATQALSAANSANSAAQNAQSTTNSKYTKPGSGIPESDLDSAVQAKLGNIGTVADGSITSAKIADGTIINTDINASAAIAQSKIANLTTDLAGKASAAHSHVISDTSGLQTALDSKANTTHAHAAADIASGTIATARLGSGAADSTTFLRGDGVWTVASSNYGGVFGDASDGALVFDGTSTVAGHVPSAGTYTLTREIMATTIVVNSGVTIRAPFWIFATVSLTNNGTIHNDGTSATNNAGASGAAAGSAGLSGAGGAGATGTGAAGAAFTGGAGGSGGGGGAGGASGASSGATPTAAPPAARLRSPTIFMSGTVLLAGTARVIGGGAGGGGGGGDTTNLGGGGGSGGGVLGIFAKALINNATIRSQGGNGATRGAGNVGGGGGGGGGYIGIFTQSTVTGTGTITVPGGSAGSGVGTGVAGTAGAVGTILQVIVV